MLQLFPNEEKYAREIEESLYNVILPAQSGDAGIRLDLKEPADLNYVALYGDPNHNSMPKSVTMVINGTYRIENVAFSDNFEPTLFSFRNLPEGVKVSSLTFYFTFEGDNDSVAIKEIIPVANAS